MILGETPQQANQRHYDRAERLRHAQETGEYIDEFTTTISPENMKQAALDTLKRVPKSLIKDQNGKIQLRKDIEMEPEFQQPKTSLAKSPIDNAIELNLPAIQKRIKGIESFQHLVRSTLKEGHDFGTIPGTPKPTLYKAGAEKIAKLLCLSDNYIIEQSTKEWTGGPDGYGFFEFQVRCELRTIPDNHLISVGVGECNSMESKYRWRDQSRKCPQCNKETIIKGKEEYGGGWLCFKKKGGCGAKFTDNAPEIINQKIGKVFNEDLASHVNTYLKMAKKRSGVDASLSAGRLSDIFTQDLEDISNEHLPDSSNQETVTEFEQKYQTDKAEQPKDTMPATTLASGRPQPTSTQIARMTRIKELVLNEAKNQGLVGEGRQELNQDENNKLANAIWHMLSSRWPKNEDDVMLCAQNIKPETIFELKMPDDTE